MKKTYPANIDGQIFYIDDDAFNLLNSYFEQLRLAFRGVEGEEIVSDIESRIREHFNNLTEAGANVIVLADVNKVIETMGRPEDISGMDEEEPRAAAGDAADRQQEPPFISINLPSRKKLYRNPRDKVFGGVIGGLAAYLGWNVNIMRILLVVLALCTYLAPLIILYLIAWMIIPAATTPKQIMEMNGTPVNVDAVGQAVMATTATPPPYSEDSDGGFWKTVFRIIGKTLMSFLGFATGCITFACSMFLIAVIIGIIASAFFSFPAILEGLDLPFHGALLMPKLIMLIAALLLTIVVCGSITWGAISVVFNTKGMSPAAMWSALILTVCCIATIICCSPLV